MIWLVSCLTDSGKRVLATRKEFDSPSAARRYAATVDASRVPEIETRCIFCGVEWRRDFDESNDWPRCINCRGC